MFLEVNMKERVENNSEVIFGPTPAPAIILSTTLKVALLISPKAQVNSGTKGVSVAVIIIGV